MAVNTKETHASPSIETLHFLGGRLCLDFINTVDPRIGKEAHDFFTSYAELVKWSQRAEVLTEDEARHLLEEASRRPAEAVVTLERAIILRETLYRVFSPVAHSVAPHADDLESIKNAFVEVMTHAKIVATPAGLVWDWVKGEGVLDFMLWPVVRSAVDLLTSQEAKKIKECPGLGDCGWLFLDTSKNGSRQWCSMEGCGSRSKMRQHYARKRASSRGQDITSHE